MKHVNKQRKLSAMSIVRRGIDPVLGGATVRILWPLRRVWICLITHHVTSLIHVRSRVGITRIVDGIDRIRWRVWEKRLATGNVRNIISRWSHLRRCSIRLRTDGRCFCVRKCRRRVERTDWRPSASNLGLLFLLSCATTFSEETIDNRENNDTNDSDNWNGDLRWILDKVDCCVDYTLLARLRKASSHLQILSLLHCPSWHFPPVPQSVPSKKEPVHWVHAPIEVLHCNEHPCSEQAAVKFKMDE